MKNTHTQKKINSDNLLNDKFDPYINSVSVKYLYSPCTLLKYTSSYVPVFDEKVGQINENEESVSSENNFELFSCQEKKHLHFFPFYSALLHFNCFSLISSQLFA